MAFTLPQFINLANVWHPPNVPPSLPDYSVMSQLYIHSRADLDVDPSQVNVFYPPIWLRVPKGTDLRVGDVCEVAAGSGFFYTAIWCERVHLGFSNEYFAAILIQGIGAPPPPSGFIALETGDLILQESGDRILVE